MKKNNYVSPCNEINKTARDVLKNFDHAMVLREDDPLLPAILPVYEEQGIRNGAQATRCRVRLSRENELQLILNAVWQLLRKL